MPIRMALTIISFWAPGPIQLNNSINYFFSLFLSEDPGRGQFIQLNIILSLIVFIDFAVKSHVGPLRKRYTGSHFRLQNRPPV